MKHMLYDVGWGYGPKRMRQNIKTIIIHTTGGRKGSSFAQEKNFLLHSRRVSAHFLVGKEGQVAQILPVEYVAWHAGETINNKKYGNEVSIGIECHLTFGEQWTDKMRAALTDLCKQLVRQYDIEHIATHREAAPGRKIDPLYWDDADFKLWAASVLAVKDDVPIIGATKPVAERILRAAATRSPLSEDTLKRIIAHYFAVGDLTRLDAVLAIAQSIHETGWFSSFWCLQHKNMAGIGVTGEERISKPDNVDGWVFDSGRNMWLRGLSFASWEDGIAAHCGRLLAYAVKEPDSIQKEYIDFALKQRPLPPSYLGSAPTVAKLSTKWAPSPSYHERIVVIYRGLTDD